MSVRRSSKMESGILVELMYFFTAMLYKLDPTNIAINILFIAIAVN